MNRSIYLDKIISCFLCNSCCDGQSWHCSICMIDICTTCHLEENEARKIEAPCKLKCGKGHQMYLYTDTTLFYKRKNAARGKIQCDFCGTSWYGRSWNCRICSYDLCTSCKDKIISGAIYFPEETKSSFRSITISSSFSIHFNEINHAERSEPSSHLILCPRNHSLIPSTHPYIWQCSICQISQTGFRLGCIQCHYFTCRTCNTYYTQNTYVDPPELKCPQNHRLVRSSDQEKMYRIRRGEYNYTGFCCNSCVKNCEGPSTHCRQCNFDLCDMCVGIIKRGIEKGVRIKCKAGHKIFWQNDTAKFYREKSSATFIYCDVCDNSIEEMGSFACRICRFDVCVKCCKSYLNS